MVSESFHTMVKHQKGGMASVCLNATINNISVLTSDIFFVWQAFNVRNRHTWCQAKRMRTISQTIILVTKVYIAVSSGKPEVRFNGSTAMLCQLRLVQFKLNLLTKLLRTELFCIIKMKITTFLDLLVALRYHNLAWSCSVHFNGDRISVIPWLFCRLHFNPILTMRFDTRWITCCVYKQVYSLWHLLHVD